MTRTDPLKWFKTLWQKWPIYDIILYCLLITRMSQKGLSKNSPDDLCIIIEPCFMLWLRNFYHYFPAFSEIIQQWLWYMAQLTECLLTRLSFSFTLSTVCNEFISESLDLVPECVLRRTQCFDSSLTQLKCLSINSYLKVRKINLY